MDKSNKDFEDRRKFMILHINKVCRSPWSEEDDKKGKTIPVKWSNRMVALSVVPLFEEKGWVIKREVMLEKSGRSLILHVQRPPRPW